MRLLPLALLGAISWGLVGCQEASPEAGDTSLHDLSPEVHGDAVSEPLAYIPCDREQRIGGFTFTLAQDYSGFSGQVMDGVVPANVPTVAAVEGDCLLLRARQLFCDPPCVPGETCGTAGSCLPYPESISVGEVDVGGLIEPFAVAAKWGNHYNNPGTMPHPGYEAGSEITLSAAGDTLEAFQLQGVGVSSLDLLGTSGQVDVAPGGDVNVAWVPGPVTAGVRVHIEMNINNHGSTSAWIACDVLDTGEYAIPATLVDALFDAGVSGFPSLEIARQSIDATVLSLGCVDFKVTSSRNLQVNLLGVQSCTKDSECPNGQVCTVELMCSD